MISVVTRKVMSFDNGCNEGLSGLRTFECCLARYLGYRDEVLTKQLAANAQVDAHVDHHDGDVYRVGTILKGV